MATYKLKYFRKFPITIRYQASLPVVGAFFSPHYEQSYYEIFVVGNSSGIVKCGYWGNGFDMKNIFTIDLPLASMNLRIGYENKIFNSNVNHLKNRRVSNSFLIVFSKEFLPVNRKKPKIQVDNIVNPIF